MLMIARKALASAHTKAFRLATRDVHCFSSILVSPPLVSLDLPENWIPYSDPPPPVSFETEQKTVVIDGNVIAEEIRTKIISEVGKMKKAVGKVPGLAVVLVGEQRDSQTYVRNKIKACEETGIKSVLAELPEDCTEGQIISVLRKFNEDTSIHGILVQLPLPQHLNESKILNMVRLEKDVDGFHPLNVGNLAMRGREPLFVSCTPKGCVELLIRTGVEIAGKNAVVIGRSNIVGLPMSLLLQA
ncbi:Amino acid dehydrogenase family protein [Arabidopsis thaliana]|uniref:Isoform 2 of Bifunctional protein FolD 1, mitochondrial n=1 Tax=Arabidopsis thaliana TaxID=3702 RepID=A2RVV7-2|nr:Amino acid dehydrogenase family protein [Arabidopsis thaliana]AAO42321.1 putative methylenetetrahydrofolate dehydrogenase [Arabidopsis thaliana]AEC09565.1 Amino acid dehydrogenase family protein [Arabidopsis thaliana]|eukprot:NP_001031508.1 Amino acid dehydrogenase family protein [Arabidopsis thaliana]